MFYSELHSQNSYTQAETPNQNISNNVKYIKRILVLGDSHMVGHFGEMLQKQLFEAGDFDILTIAIGGAGSRHFTMTMRNNCCGYIIRESQIFEKISGGKSYRVNENSFILSGELIGKIYSGKLENIVIQFDPNVVIVSLGHNFINDHQNLVDIIRSSSPSCEIIWMGPILNNGIQSQLHAINKVVTDNGLKLVRSDDLLGSDTAGCAHYSGRIVERWTKAIVSRLKPLLLSEKHMNFNETTETLNFYPDTLAIFKHFAEDEMVVVFREYKPEVYQMLLSIFQFDFFYFDSRYLHRSYSKPYIETSQNETLTDIDGNIYKTVVVENTVWMAENLRTKRYRDGSLIGQKVLGKHYFLEDAPAIRFEINKNKVSENYYTWYAVSDPRGLCPEGWHIPDVSEWMYLKEHLETPENYFSNSFDWINSDGRTIQADSTAFWWSISTVSDHTQSAWVNAFDFKDASLILLNRNRKSGFMVRCVKD